MFLIARKEDRSLSVLIVYYVIMQPIGFYIMGLDKRRAQKGEWRIPEKRLWLFAWIGAGLGLWAGMHYFRHKTKHPSFRIGFPFLTVVHIILFVFLVSHFLH